MWSSDEYFAKAIVYGRRASSANLDQVTRGLFLSISLEMVAKALLCKAHPAFLADNEKIDDAIKSANSLLVPKTLNMSRVLDRLAIIHPELRHRLVEDLKKFVSERNNELHSSDHSFESMGEKYWLPLVVNGIAHLTDLLGHSANSFLDNSLFEMSSKFQNENKLDTEKRVDSLISSAKGKWNSLPESQKSLLRASIRPGNLVEHVLCPACESQLTVIHGSVPLDSSLSQRNGSWERVRLFEVLRVRCEACAFALNDPHEILFAGLPEDVSTVEYLTWDEAYEEGFYEEYGDE